MRKKQYIENKKNKSKLSIKLTLMSFIFFILLLTSVVYFIWRVFKLDKFVFVNKDINTGNTEIYVVNGTGDDNKKYILDGNLLLESSLSYGEYTLNNLWTLSEKEGIGEELVMKSIVKNFNLPIYFYINDSKSNMDVFHKIKAKNIMSRKLYDEISIKDLAVPKYITADFVDQQIQELGSEVTIEDLTGSQYLAEKVAKIIDVLGSKVVDYKKGYDEKLDCEVVSSGNELLANKLSLVFDCDKKINKDLSNGKVVLKMGNQFLLRF